MNNENIPVTRNNILHYFNTGFIFLAFVNRKLVESMPNSRLIYWVNLIITSNSDPVIVHILFFFSILRTEGND